MKTSNTDSDNEDSEIGGKKQRKITVMMWGGVEVETVGRLPEGIDVTQTPSKMVGNGNKMPNGLERPWTYALWERCPFKVQYGVINTTQFEKKGTADKFVKDVDMKASLCHVMRGDTCVTRKKESQCTITGNIPVQLY